MTRRYNLAVEPWIPMLRQDGTSTRVGIMEALADARAIRTIAASNPMDRVALLRFLLAVLHWCKPALTEIETTRLDRARGIPEDWLGSLGTRANPEHAFDLLGPGPRFYQEDPPTGARRPIGDLLVEFPTDTKIAHFRHVRDGEYGFCPACCALGIVRFCTFANAYGGGRYTAAVNGPTPAYAIEQAQTLFGTLRRNWPVERLVRRRDPPWICASRPAKEALDLVAAFAWRSRTMRLEDPQAEGVCANCGECTALIHHVNFKGGWKPFDAGEQQKKFWEFDPHLVLEYEPSTGDEGTCDGEADEGDRGQKRTLGFPSPSSHVATHVGFWRRAGRAIVEGRRADGRGDHRVTIAGPAANKGLYQDAAFFELPLALGPRALAVQVSAVKAVPGRLRRATRNPKREHPELTAAWQAMSPALEVELLPYVVDPQPGDQGASLVARLQPVLARILRSTPPGPPLRRSEV